MSLKSLFRIHCPWFPRLAVCAGWISILLPAHAQNVAFAQALFSPIAVGGRPTTPVIADLNGDGRADIVVALESDHAIAVLLGRPQGGFQPAPGSPFPAGNLPFSIAVADLDGDSHLDVVAVNRTDNHLTLLRGDGLGGFTPLGKPVPTGNEPRTGRIADFNGDGKPDLAVANYEAQSVSLLLGNGLGVFTPAPGSPVLVGRNPWGLTVADFNGDGAIDFAVANRADDSVSVLLNDGKAGFTASGSPIAVGSQPFDVTSADLNHNGKVDLVSADTGSHTITAFLGNGTGSFTQPVGGSVPVQGGYPRMVVAADLNSDGYLDLVTANEHSSISLLAGRGNGAFLPMGTSPLWQPNIMNTVAVGDLNGDGAPDLVGCGPDFGLMIWLNAVLKPAIQVSETYANEGDGKARIFLKRVSNPDQELSLLVETRDDTAIAGSDYQPIRERVTFAPGQVNLVVEVPVIDDDWGASDRRFLVEFSDANLPVSLPWASAVHIRDNDEQVTVRSELAGPGLSADLASVSEGAGPLRFIARRTGSVSSLHRFQVRYRIEGVPLWDARPARAGIDFRAPLLEGTFEFGPGVTEQSVEVALPETADAEGPRGLSFKLSDSETVLYGGDEPRVVVIRDNERSSLRQVLALAPYLDSLGDVLQLPGGETLLIGEDSLLKLTREGLPDPTFGAGTGRITTGFPHEVKVLGAGQIQVWDTASVGRWLRNGERDFSFGDGTGRLVLPTPLLETSETGELLTTRSSDGGASVVRLRSDGSIDPRFTQTLPAYSEIAWARTAPDGRIWAGVHTSQKGPAMVILEPDGQPTPSFAPLFGELFLHGFDQAGRGYLEIRLPEGNVQWTRFLANGTPDPGYRFTLPCCANSLAEVSSDGSLILLDGTGLAEVDPEGVSRAVPSSSLLGLDRVARLASGDLLIRTFFCFGGPWPGGGCSTGHTLLTADGVRVPIQDFSVWWPRPGDPILFSRTRPSFEGNDTDFRVYRTSIGQRSNEVGILFSGLTCLESSIRVPLERSGNTAQAATVRGRVFPLIGGRWDEISAHPFEVRFEVGKAEAELVLPSVAQPGSQPLREYLVRLEEAAGVALSSFTACRLWVVDEELPEPGRLHLLPYPGPDEANALLAVSRQPAGQRETLVKRIELGIPVFGFDPSYTRVGDLRLQTLSTAESPTGFFQLRTP